MDITFNGTEINTTKTILAEVLEEKSMKDKTGIAVALNNAVIPKSKWQETQIKPNDKILIITATQGG